MVRRRSNFSKFNWLQSSPYDFFSFAVLCVCLCILQSRESRGSCSALMLSCPALRLVHCFALILDAIRLFSDYLNTQLGQDNFK